MTNTLIGFTDSRTTADTLWPRTDGTVARYPGAIPLAHVAERLFNWQAVSQPLYTGRPDDGGMTLVPGRQAITRSDTGQVLGIFKAGYQPHQYQEWLITKVSNILHGDAQCGGAGIVKGGGAAWVSVELPESFTVADVDYRPNLIACTSLDGSLASTYMLSATVIACTNQLNGMFRDARSNGIKIKHTRYSPGRVQDIRAALGLIYQARDVFEEYVTQWTGTKMTDLQFARFADRWSGLDKAPVEGRGRTVAENKRDSITALWRDDPRVAPWAGSVYGAVAAANTYAHHMGTVRNTTRGERAMLNTLNGRGAQSDNAALHLALEAVRN